MSSPRRLEVPLSSSGYHMEVDTRKSDCNRESAHWHLCRHGSRVGSINVYGSWVQYPDVDRRIKDEAERLTKVLARRYGFRLTERESRSFAEPVGRLPEEAEERPAEPVYDTMAAAADAAEQAAEVAEGAADVPGAAAAL